jgi:mRNA interferase RelE/StbE
MWYDLRILPDAERDLRGMSPEVARRVLRKLEAMQNDLAGDVKRLVALPYAYRLRVGDWRVMFDVVDQTIIVHRVRHRSIAY